MFNLHVFLTVISALCAQVKFDVDQLFDFTTKGAGGVFLGTDYGAKWHWERMPGGATVELWTRLTYKGSQKYILAGTGALAMPYLRHNYNFIDTCGGVADPHTTTPDGKACVDMTTYLKRGDIVRLVKLGTIETHVVQVRSYGVFDKYQVPITPLFKDRSNIASGLCLGLAYDANCNTPISVEVSRLSRDILVIGITDATGFSSKPKDLAVEELRLTMKEAGNLKDRYGASSPSTESAVVM